MPNPDVDPSLDDVTGADVRYVAVTWHVDSDSLPELHLGGCSEFEALGFLVTAVDRLTLMTSQLLEFPGDIVFEEPDDDA